MLLLGAFGFRLEIHLKNRVVKSAPIACCNLMLLMLMSLSWLQPLLRLHSALLNLLNCQLIANFSFTRSNPSAGGSETETESEPEHEPTLVATLSSTRSPGWVGGRNPTRCYGDGGHNG